MLTSDHRLFLQLILFSFIGCVITSSNCLLFQFVLLCLVGSVLASCDGFLLNLMLLSFSCNILASGDGLIFNFVLFSLLKCVIFCVDTGLGHPRFISLLLCSNCTSCHYTDPCFHRPSSLPRIVPFGLFSIFLLNLCIQRLLFLAVVLFLFSMILPLTR